MRELILAALVLCWLTAMVLADGYGGGGGGHPMIINSGGGDKKGKWQMKAKGKGMQNLYTYGGGGGGGKEYHEDYHQNEVYYYPVPIYTPYHAHEEEESHKEDDHKVSVIPISGMGGGMGGMGGHGYKRMGFDGIGGLDYATLLQLLAMNSRRGYSYYF